MDTMLQIVRQEEIEGKFNRKLIDPKIREAILANPDMVAKIEQGVALVQDYCNQQTYASKMARLAQVAQLDHEQLVEDIFVGIAYYGMPTLLTSACATISSRLGFSDRREAILTVSELIAILADTDAFDLTKENRQASVMVVSRIPLEQELVEFAQNTSYMPPMVCTPLELTGNYSSGYLTYKDSLILGPGNHHEGDICLDALNTMNSVKLKLAVEFLKALDETPKTEPETAEQRDLWQVFKAKSRQFYIMVLNLAPGGFHLNHKVDKRGRAYAQGYHISTQGSAYKKAMIELANEEVIDGVPI